MKEIKAVIQPGKLQKLRAALTALPDFPGMTVTRSEGCSPAADLQSRTPDIHAELTDFSPKVRLELIVEDSQVERIVDLIRTVCHTGHLGDGVVWVTAVDHFARIREAD